MGVTNTVKDLAEAVSLSKRFQDPRHKLQVEILQAMPQYAQIRDLGAWEAAFQKTLPEPDDLSEISLLLYAIFEFGQFNLYGKFQPVETIHQYALLREHLTKHGVQVQNNPSLGDW